MPQNYHSSTPFTVSSALSIGAPISTILGGGKGTGQASEVLFEALQECNL